MLKSLSIRNYALIEKLDINFENGFSTITGETGAGKTILLGALGLLVGNRANTSVLKDKQKKCVVEAVFYIKDYKFEKQFEENDVDYEDYTIVRREISPQSKSRAFINDTPVQVSLLKIFGDQLIDIHSQHQNLILNDNLFQLRFVDNYAATQNLLSTYSQEFLNYKELQTKIEGLESLANQSQVDYDYNQFLYDELEKNNLVESEQEDLENEQKTLSNSEEIMSLISLISSNLSQNEENIVGNLSSLRKPMDSLQSLMPATEELFSRFDSMYLELQDIANEYESLTDSVEFNPAKLEQINERLNILYQLQKKHNVNSVKELIEIKENLEIKLSAISNHDEVLQKMRAELNEKKENLEALAEKISKKRASVLGSIELRVVSILRELGMPNSRFKIIQSPTKELTNYGLDRIDFKFSANKHGDVESIAKIASGGEISRLMLSLKSIICSLVKLPTIIFDEIDTGVSGNISTQMGIIMTKMSENMQVLSITHQPQIASMGVSQYKVVKTEDEITTQSNIVKLQPDERVTEIAKMLSGEQVSEAALENAKILLHQR